MTTFEFLLFLTWPVCWILGLVIVFGNKGAKATIARYIISVIPGINIIFVLLNLKYLYNIIIKF